MVMTSAFVLPAAAKMLTYGERAGMEVTINKKSGIGTANAKILTKHTRQNAIGYCRGYVGKVTESRVAKELKTPLHLEITPIARPAPSPLSMVPTCCSKAAVPMARRRLPHHRYRDWADAGCPNRVE